MRQNPFFNYLPIEGTKGELIIINAPKLNSEVIIKSSVFIIPIGNNGIIYKNSATLNISGLLYYFTKLGLSKNIVQPPSNYCTCDTGKRVDHAATLFIIVLTVSPGEFF